MLGLCPVCRRAFPCDEWSKMRGRTEWTYIDGIQQIVGDVTECPGCGHEVYDDAIEFLDEENKREV